MFSKMNHNYNQHIPTLPSGFLDKSMYPSLQVRSDLHTASGQCRLSFTVYKWCRQQVSTAHLCQLCLTSYSHFWCSFYMSPYSMAWLWMVFILASGKWKLAPIINSASISVCQINTAVSLLQNIPKITFSTLCIDFHALNKLVENVQRNKEFAKNCTPQSSHLNFDNPTTFGQSQAGFTS